MTDVLGVSLPVTWSASRLKHVTSFLNRGTAPDYVDVGAVRAISQAANQDGGLDWSRTRFHNFSGDPARLKGLLYPHDVIVNSTGTGTLGRVGYFRGSPDGIPCMADGHVSIARFLPSRLYPRYAYYWMRAQQFQDYIYAALVVGATNQIELNRERLADAPVPLPPIEEQRRIADFLDAETARIDTFIELRSRWASLLLQRFDESVRQSTRESGDERFIPLRRILARIKTGATPRADQTDLFVEKGVPWYTPGSFLSGVSLGSAERSIDPSAVKRSVPRFPADSVVIVGIGATAGRVAYLDRDGTGNQQLTALTFQPEVHARFLAWQLYAVTDELRQLAPFTTLPIINNDFLKAFPVWSPAPERQRAIAADIDRDWVLLQDLLDAQERQRALLAERRQALITASVTGQFDVTTAKGVDLP